MLKVVLCSTAHTLDPEAKWELERAFVQTYKANCKKQYNSPRTAQNVHLKDHSSPQVQLKKKKVACHSLNSPKLDA